MGTKECKNRGVSKSTPLRGDVERRCCSAPVTRQIGDAGFCNWSSISNGDGRSDVGVEYGAERILVDERVGGNQMGRPYKKKRDREAVRRIFRESGWIEDTKEELAELDRILDRSSVRVADVDGDAECAVTTVPGDYRHGQETLPYSIVASVNTGRIGRKRGLATRVLAESLAESKRAGAAAAGLGFFEQGFYDRLGFGTTCYERHIRFDPANLSPDLPSPEPIRLGLDDYREIHDHLRSRLRQHGSVNAGPAEFTRFAMFEARNGFALGIREGGKLVSHVFLSSEDVESGPYTVVWCAWSDWKWIPATFGILRNLADQVQLLEMREPAYLQMQDFLLRPLRSQELSGGSKREQRVVATAYHQMRILDLPTAISTVALPVGEVEFDLSLSDPIESMLGDADGWRGCGGSIRFASDRIRAAQGVFRAPRLSCEPTSEP